jgi:hypothetical protein
MNIFLRKEVNTRVAPSASRIYKKFKMAPREFSGAGGKTIHKKPKSKIL